MKEMKDERIHVVQAGLFHSNEYAFVRSRIDPITSEKREPYPLPFGFDPSKMSRDHSEVSYHGVEPHPKYYQKFIEKYGNQQNEKYYNVAISGSNGEIEIHDMSRRERGKPPEYIKVPAMTIETFLEEASIARCHLLVLDIEGWEYEALKAYKGKIPIDFIIVEFHPKARKTPQYDHSCSAEDFESMCHHKGFKITSRYLSNNGHTIDYHLEIKRTGEHERKI